MNLKTKQRLKMLKMLLSNICCVVKYFSWIRRKGCCKKEIIFRYFHGFQKVGKVQRKLSLSTFFEMDFFCLKEKKKKALKTTKSISEKYFFPCKLSILNSSSKHFVLCVGHHDRCLSLFSFVSFSFFNISRR